MNSNTAKVDNLLLLISKKKKEKNIDIYTEKYLILVFKESKNDYLLMYQCH